MDYQDFLKTKARVIPPSGFDAINLNSNLFDFQADIVKWACKRGKAAIFAGTGLGKSLMELSWADQVVKKEKKPVLIFTPLAVSHQMKSEADKFGINDVLVVKEGGSSAKIQITNYQKLDKFDLSQYVGVILDESSILKNESGKYRTELIERCKNIPYKLAATATPSPNDYMELGNHAEFLGIMSYSDMLSTFFVHDGSSTQNWRLKGHAESKFWEWMATWSVMLQNPNDLGYDGKKYILPKLNQKEIIVKKQYEASIETGNLFPMQANGLSERLKARRDTIQERCNEAANLVNSKKDVPWVIWCNLNDESDLLCSMIEGAVSIKGSDKDTIKEQRLKDFSDGSIRVLVTKPSICGFGMNWQHCNNTVFVGLNDSFEQIYQAIRRFWRFGQKNQVNSYFIASEIEGAVLQNIKRKEKQADHMMMQMIKHMSDLNSANIKGLVRDTLGYHPQDKVKLPNWL